MVVLRRFCAFMLLHFFHAHFFFASANDVDSQLMEDINQYRTQVVGVPAFVPNSGASCMAEHVLTKFEGTSCTNATGLDTVPGEEPQFPEYSDWLTTCKLTAESTSDGQILPDCIPSGIDISQAAKAAALNYTHTEYINSTKYISAGVASSDNWFVLVLATNASNGNYLQTSGGNYRHTSVISLLIGVTLSLFYV